MAKSDNIRGVEKIGIGDPGDGVAGSSLTEFKNVVVQSLTFKGSETQTKTIPTEQNDSYMTVEESTTPPEVNFKLYEVAGESLKDLIGGEWDASEKEWKAPKKNKSPFKTVQITSEAIDGKKQVITFPYVKITALHDGTITKNDLLTVSIKALANTPVSSGGEEGSPYSIKQVDA